MTARSLSSGILSLLPPRVRVPGGQLQADRMILLEFALDEPAAYFGKSVCNHSLRIWRALLVTARYFINVSVSFSSHNSLRPMLLCVRFTRCQYTGARCRMASVLLTSNAMRYSTPGVMR